MKKHPQHMLLSAAAAALFMANTASATSTAPKYGRDVQPIFDTFCVECHQPGGEGFEASGLDLSSYEGVMKGTKLGAIVSPGDPITSNLMAVLEGRTSAAIRMPHSKRRDMTKVDRAILRRWIIDGATKEGFYNGPSDVIAELCVDCHQPGGMGFDASGLDMRSYESLMKGTAHGPVVVPGDAFTSNLMVLIEGRAAGMLKMPHQERPEPTAQDRTVLRRWIMQGAKNN